jgi:hypothetical protein
MTKEMWKKWILCVAESAHKSPKNVVASGAFTIQSVVAHENAFDDRFLPLAKLFLTTHKMHLYSISKSNKILSFGSDSSR